MLLLDFRTMNLDESSYIWPLSNLRNSKFKSIFICFASIKLDETMNLDQASYIFPLLDSITMNLHDHTSIKF